MVLIQDNLNSSGSFYEASSEEAYRLSTRFEVHYTPFKGSWLNMVKIELAGERKLVQRTCSFNVICKN